MAKISKRTLGRRRRGALYVLLFLIIGIVFLLTRCGGNSDQSAEEASISISPTEMETTATTFKIAETIETTAVVAETSAQENEENAAVLPAAASIDVEPILQLPELPTGCEVTSLTMALNYAGYSVDKLTVADDYLVCADPYTATFGEAFIGSPYDATAWGCYAPVIVKTAEAFLQAHGGTESVQDLTGSSIDTLFQEIANGTPVITWVTIGMTDDINENYYWTTEDGKEAVFLSNEHCILLCGYDMDEQTVLTCDPLVGLIEYDMDVFQDRFERMYSQAVVIN